MKASDLTAEEQELCSLVLRGVSVAQAAKAAGIPESTARRKLRAGRVASYLRQCRADAIQPAILACLAVLRHSSDRGLRERAAVALLSAASRGWIDGLDPAELRREIRSTARMVARAAEAGADPTEPDPQEVEAAAGSIEQALANDAAEPEPRDGLAEYVERSKRTAAEPLPDRDPEATNAQQIRKKLGLNSRGEMQHSQTRADQSYDPLA